MGAYLIAKQIVSMSTKANWIGVSNINLEATCVYVVLSKYDNNIQPSLSSTHRMVELHLLSFMYTSVSF